MRGWCRPGYDIVGDIHGCASTLQTLRGYHDRAGTLRHPQRQTISVGDLVDRSSEQLGVLEIVRGIVDGGSARIVMGNHEFNAVGDATELPPATVP
ncbi:metallophosphoesterase [Mycobacterium sp. ML4]